MLKSQSRFVTNHFFVVDEFSKAAHTHLVVTLWVCGETHVLARVHIHTYVFMSVCMYVHVTVRVCACLLLGSFCGVGNCTTCCTARSTHTKNKERARKQQLGKL